MKKVTKKRGVMFCVGTHLIASYHFHFICIMFMAWSSAVQCSSLVSTMSRHAISCSGVLAAYRICISSPRDVLCAVRLGTGGDSLLGSRSLLIYYDAMQCRDG